MINDSELSLLDDNARRLFEAYRKGQHASLLNEVDELAKVGNLSPGILGIASLSLTALERYGEAATAARTALATESGWAWLYDAKAAVAAGLKELPAAVTAETRAVQLGPTEPAYLIKLAHYLRLTGQLEQAIAASEQALRLRPAHVGALNELGLAFEAGGDEERALQAYAQAQTADPSDPWCCVHEAAARLRRKETPRARQALREALRREPGMTQAEDRMIETFWGTGLAGQMGVHVLNLARVTLIGWSMIAFVYYLGFRLLEFLWKAFPATMPYGRAMLLTSLVYLLGGMTMGHLLRFAFRSSNRLPSKNEGPRA